MKFYSKRMIDDATGKYLYFCARLNALSQETGTEEGWSVLG